MQVPGVQLLSAVPPLAAASSSLPAAAALAALAAPHTTAPEQPAGVCNGRTHRAIERLLRQGVQVCG